MNFLIANILLIAINLVVLGLGIKLYTEILKDQSQNRRMGQSQKAPDSQILTDKQVDRLLDAKIPGGSSARDWFLPHEHEKGLNNVRDVVRIIVATSKEIK